MTLLPPLVVGIGASAGGIPALEGFFRALPDDSGMAFVIVTHLSPDRHSLLHEVIRRYTSTPVEVAEDGAMVRGNCVYVMPEGKILTIRNGIFHLRGDDPLHRERKPIDLFFASLAEDQGENAVGIIMSGGDSDGTLGIKTIKERGGITMAQTGDGSGPRNPEMPHSAMATGLIDFAEPAERMPERLLQIRDGIEVPPDLKGEPDRPPSTEEQQAQADIARLLRSHSGHDFSGYKRKTFLRRVARRMKVVQVGALEDYIRFLKDHPKEVAALFHDLLINVTGFFRDAEAFAALKSQVIPRLFEGRGADETIRIWVPGCATGEEAYTLAMLMREQMDGLDAVPKIQIFATDIDSGALAAARAGRYPHALLDHMEPDRLKRFFRRDGASCVVSKEVREMCIFSPHNVIADPPFSRMDMVSCRNLLIYLGADLQNQVIPTFHYALKPGGYLFLGTSEGVSRHGELFAPLDKQHRIFQSRDHGGRRRLPIPVDLAPARSLREDTQRGFYAVHGHQLRQRVEMQVLERHAPAHVVVSHDGEILHFSGNTGRYLEMPCGAPNRQILELARREIRLDLRAALRQTMETGGPAERHVLMLDHDGEDGSMVRLATELLDGAGAGEALCLVLFSPEGQWRGPAAADGTDPGSADAVAALERDLRDMRERLQSTVEEYETALEELKSSNEELVSVNEEAQSTNEELEASREEMQSLNEELSTINAELATSVEELDRSNSDLKNLFAATRIATIFLDRDLVIRNFTPAAASIFNIRQSDIGRPLLELAGVLHYPDLQAQVREVHSTGHGVEHRVASGDDGQHFLVRLEPYRNRDDGIDGVVVTFVDVSTLAQAEEQQKILISELNHRVKNMLAVAISITRNTRKTAPDMDEFARRLIGRLHGMSRAYSLLSQADWTVVPLADLIRTEAEAFGAGRIRMQGPNVPLKPHQALSLAVVIHEMATNAAKYGSLSADAGKVNVGWQVEQDRLALTWVEEGGPPVRSPERNGFGLVLIEGQVRSQMEGEIEFH
ncbi:CheR family methyltransferase, partial [Hoeflea sp.]|uniref:CheR family methyltransferase n=1 Tax=Hoeflea sp. TaxID=1940281 RepID=UPI0019ADCC37